MALRSVMSSKIPTVIIVGATGTGKTKLSISLAQKFRTEVISADSMQIYRGLDVVTAKATPHERSLVPHHLLDILEPTQYFTVVDFRNRALKIIDSLTEQGKIPIVVGGTNYYIESIVYKILVENMDDPASLLWEQSRRKRDFDSTQAEASESKQAKVETDGYTDESKDFEDKVAEKGNGNEADVSTVADPNPAKVTREVLQREVDNEKQYTNEQLHQKLRAFDPVMAARLHPNNRRKVLRAMEVWLKTGRLQSELLAEQRLSEGQLRRPGATVVLWLKCDQKVHDARLDARVEAMLREGLVGELLEFHQRHNRQRLLDGQPPDYTKGIFQTLGFKEFHEYLMLSPEARSSDPGRKLLDISVENMKIATRRYARRQNKMVRGRFLEHPQREIPSIYELDTTDLTKWTEEVEEKASHIIQSFLDEAPCKYEPLKSDISEEKRNNDGNSRNYCESCERLIIGDRTFKLHLESFRHQKVLKKKRKLEKQNQN